jgi:hypothetical protein
MMRGGLNILTNGDITANLLIILFFSGGFYLVGTAFIRRNDEDTEYTKNVKLSKSMKTMLLLFYEGDKVEMEAVIHNGLLIILTIILSIIAFYIIIPNITLALFYLAESWGVFIGCLIYRFKKHDFKNSKDHYE